MKRYLGLVKSQLKDNVSFEEALRIGYKAALCSTDFLFSQEPRRATRRLGDCLAFVVFPLEFDARPHALRPRRKGAAQGRATLRAQVDRMLKDPKAERFVVDFLDQWLELRDIEFTTPDRKLYPEFAPFLRDSMVVESQAFFRELLENDLGVAILSCRILPC